MTSISSTITTNVDKKIQQFIDALSEQLSIEKEELYEIFNSIVESDEDDGEVDDEEEEKESEGEIEGEIEDVSDSSEEKEEEPVVQQQVHRGKCEYIYTKGKSEGTRCTTNVEGTKFCKKHASSEPKVEVKTVTKPDSKEVKTPVLNQAPTKGKCEYVFTKGKNEGQRCTTNVEGTKFCKKHAKDDKEEVKEEVVKKEAKKESPPKKNSKTKKVDDEQKDKETINRLVDSNMNKEQKSEKGEKSEKSEKVVKKGEPVLSLSRNRFGNFEMPETGFVFDPKTRQVIGTQNENGSIDDLTVEDIALCKEYGFHNVKVPEKLKTVGSDSESSDDDYEIEDEDEDDDEEDFDEEDFDEEDD